MLLKRMDIREVLLGPDRVVRGGVPMAQQLGNCLADRIHFGWIPIGPNVIRDRLREERINENMPTLLIDANSEEFGIGSIAVRAALLRDRGRGSAEGWATGGTIARTIAITPRWGRSHIAAIVVIRSPAGTQRSLEARSARAGRAAISPGSSLGRGILLHGTLRHVIRIKSESRHRR